jgi:5-bromo-4-chloroindolyl phosphate hydrolysis protein
VDLLMWMVGGIVAAVAVIALVPVLIIGGWFVIITVIMGLADGAIALLDQRWKMIRGRKKQAGLNPSPSLVSGRGSGGNILIPALSAPSITP